MKHKWTTDEDEYCVDTVFSNFVFQDNNYYEVLNNTYNHFNRAIEKNSLNMKFQNIKYLLEENCVKNHLNIGYLANASQINIALFKVKLLKYCEDKTFVDKYIKEKKHNQNLNVPTLDDVNNLKVEVDEDKVRVGDIVTWGDIDDISFIITRKIVKDTPYIDGQNEISEFAELAKNSINKKVGECVKVNDIIYIIKEKQ